MNDLLPASCRLCPRACGADRAAGQRGLCGADDTLVVARAALHFWEEPPISGQAGSGTVFFAHCPLRCVYCQNAVIAARTGRAGGHRGAAGGTVQGAGRPGRAQREPRDADALCAAGARRRRARARAGTWRPGGVEHGRVRDAGGRARQRRDGGRVSNRLQVRRPPPGRAVLAGPRLSRRRAGRARGHGGAGGRACVRRGGRRCRACGAAWWCATFCCLATWTTPRRSSRCCRNASARRCCSLS